MCRAAQTDKLNCQMHIRLGRAPPEANLNVNQTPQQTNKYNKKENKWEKDENENENKRVEGKSRMHAHENEFDVGKLGGWASTNVIDSSSDKWASPTR